jgi:hypothetical protein
MQPEELPAARSAFRVGQRPPLVTEREHPRAVVGVVAFAMGGYPQSTTVDTRASRWGASICVSPFLRTTTSTTDRQFSSASRQNQFLPRLELERLPLPAVFALGQRLAEGGEVVDRLHR